MLAMNGCDVTGIDLVENTITYANAKAIERHVKVSFIIGLRMDRLLEGNKFDIVIDSGLFHVMRDEDRPIFARQIKRVLRTGGKYFMLCSSDKEPTGSGLRRVSKIEIEYLFVSF